MNVVVSVSEELDTSVENFLAVYDFVGCQAQREVSRGRDQCVDGRVWEFVGWLIT